MDEAASLDAQNEGTSSRTQRERKAPIAFDAQVDKSTKKRKTAPLKQKQKPPKLPKSKPIELKKSAGVKPLTGKLKMEDDMEEQFILENCSEPASFIRSASSRVSSDVENIKEAIRFCVKDCAAVMLDWTTPQASRVGKPIKVYWEGDEAWYYATILYYDQLFDRYFVSIS